VSSGALPWPDVALRTANYDGDSEVAGTLYFYDPESRSLVGGMRLSDLSGKLPYKHKVEDRIRTLTITPLCKQETPTATGSIAWSNVLIRRK
jgi:hypothetical protein